MGGPARTRRRRRARLWTAPPSAAGLRGHGAAPSPRRQRHGQGAGHVHRWLLGPRAITSCVRQLAARHPRAHGNGGRQELACAYGHWFLSWTGPGQLCAKGCWQTKVARDCARIARLRWHGVALALHLGHERLREPTPLRFECWRRTGRFPRWQVAALCLALYGRAPGSFFALRPLARSTTSSCGASLPH